MSDIRLNKYLAQAGICSRRKADEHILAGEVYVNGQQASLGLRVDPENDQVVFQDKVVSSGQQEPVYYAVYKPAGVISTAADERGRAIITELVPAQPRVYPVGRLDKDSEGLMILTNDGRLTYQLTHPKFEHQKEYELTVRRKKTSMERDQIKEVFEEGIEFEGTVMKADRVCFASDNRARGHKQSPAPKLLTMYMILHTGYKRQIWRMCEAVGLSIASLTRIRMGRLELKSLGLKPGEYRKISKSDIMG